jgi:hypothetical protein
MTQTRAKRCFVQLVWIMALLAQYSSHSLALGTLTVTWVAASNSSVKIYFNPVPGAKDYRVYDVANPNDVKYAGLAHVSPSLNCPGPYCHNHFLLQADNVTPVFPYQVGSGPTGGPQVLDVPATQVEWNNVGDGRPHTVVVEAVDQLGPVPQRSLYDGVRNTPLVPGGMLGSNKGPTNDQKTSTNGQGPYTNHPQVIAQSRQFVVRANQDLKAIPSRASATQLFFDTFENSENATIRQVSRDDNIYDSFGNVGVMKYTMNAGTARAWEIEYRRADNLDSMPFISGDHFMDMLFDGASPTQDSSPTHTLYGSMSMTPAQTLDMSGGKMLHMTMEVDAHQSFRRWLAFNLVPASDPLQAWDPEGFAINNTDRGIFLELRDGFCTLDIYTHRTSPSDPSPTGTAGGTSEYGARLWGLPGGVGGAPIMCGWDEMYIQENFSKNGLGLDDKSRLDFFISQRHAALFQDGHLIVQSDIPAGSLPWATEPLKAYYSHYLYHSDADIIDLHTYQDSGQSMCYALNSYWFNNPVSGTAANQSICNTAYPPGYGFPHSDERHWDNMGYEVWPAADVPGSDFSTLAPLVQLPTKQAPQFVGGGAPAAPTHLRITP